MADPSSRTAVKIPAYTTDLNMTAQGAESSIDLQVFNSKSDLLAGSLIDAKIKAGAAACVEPPCSYENSLAGINPGPATYFDDGASTESFAYTGVLGNVNTPWIIQLTTNSHLSTGSYKYSHGDRSPQAATDCTGATPVSGCDVYDASMAQMAAQVWGSLDDGQIAQMSIDTAILIDGFLPWFNWFRSWSSVMSSVPLWAEKPEKSEHVFRYADEDNDGYISSTEFELLRKVKVRYCKVSANRYQSSLLLFGSSLSPNPWAADVGSGCGSFGSYIVDVMAPTIEKTTTPFSLGVLPAGLKDFEIAFSSSGQCVTNLKLFRDADSSEIMDTSTTAAASGQIFSAGGAQANFVEYENVTESERRNLVITGRITEALQLSLTNDCPGFSYKSVHLKYKYDGLDPCSNSTGDAHGCTELDYTIADKELSSWSTNIANVHTSVTPAWAEMEQYRTYGDKEAIPVSEFYPVWCERSVDNIPPCSSWLRGFYRMDENHDGLVSYIEFKNAYDLQGSSVMVNELLGASRLSPLQYESTEFPMAPMPELPHCHCSTKLGEGWNSKNKVCMKKSQTGCEECMKQRKCASIVTATGDGLRDFEGDCVYPGQTSMCLSSTDASLAFPGAIAIDDDDNIYVADHGNNRIRMVKTATNHILTIAGSGRLGFAGDGGPGIEASLRYPEGIVVNTQRGTANAGRAREVFFSDFFNQRIRKVTLTVVNGIDVWTIYTVLGTGERGENPDCDAGCDAAVAILNNPRALAFSRSQDLYIVDSGVRKIRKFTVYASTPTLSTFIGSGVELDKTFGVSMKVFENVPLWNMG
jgi:DNA-binding beta-propeller fold protein YncE